MHVSYLREGEIESVGERERGKRERERERERLVQGLANNCSIRVVTLLETIRQDNAHSRYGSPAGGSWPLFSIFLYWNIVTFYLGVWFTS